MPIQIQKQKLILISGVVLGLVAIVLVKGYIDQQRKQDITKIRKRAEQILSDQTVVLVARQEIPKGVFIETTMIDTKIIPNQHVTPQAVTSLDRITGMVTVAPILKGEQITLTKLSSNPRPEGGGLAGITPVGKRAITISVDNVAAVAGLIKPGDYVDVISLIGVPMRTADDKIETQIVVLPLFQNVLVLAVGRDTGSPKKEGGRYQKEGEDAGGSLITLALSPQEASLIAFISEQGRIRLILRSPADAKLETTQTASWDTLFRYINPNYSDQPPSQPMPVVSENREEAKPAVPQGETIEIYRGLSKERIPISR